MKLLDMDLGKLTDKTYHLMFGQETFYNICLEPQLWRYEFLTLKYISNRF